MKAKTLSTRKGSRPRKPAAKKRGTSPRTKRDVTAGRDAGTLSIPQQRFADGVLQGLSQSEAYRRAYPRARKAIETSASRLAASAKVRQYLQAMRAKEEKRGGLTRQRKREILQEIADDVKTSPGDRVRALQVDNRMTGDDAPVRVEGEITLNTIFRALAPSTGLPGDEEDEEHWGVAVGGGGPGLITHGKRRVR